MRPPTTQAQNLLDWLYRRLQPVRPGDISTYSSYGQALHDLRLKPLIRKTAGQSLQPQGLDDLAKWTAENDMPGITGIIINVSDPAPKQPGDGYFTMYGRAVGDIEWWHEQVRRAKLYRWEPFVTPSVIREVEEAARSEGSVAPLADDLAEPPEWVQSVVTRVVRDSKKVRELKALHKNLCQICQVPVKLPDGKLYSEVHHIQPLGGDHEGHDIWPNMLCVCPNCHALLDLRAMELLVENIYLAPGHRLGIDYLKHHNDIFHTKWNRREDPRSTPSDQPGTSPESNI
jgi:HNH endonuclease